MDTNKRKYPSKRTKNNLLSDNSQAKVQRRLRKSLPNSRTIVIIFKSLSRF